MADEISLIQFLLPVLIIVGSVLVGKHSVVCTLKKVAYSLVLDAEGKFKTGELKHDYVIGLLVERVPSVLKPFIKESDLETILETSVQRLKGQLKTED